MIGELVEHNGLLAFGESQEWLQPQMPIHYVLACRCKPLGASMELLSTVSHALILASILQIA
ncbi:hypothetical protein [Stutzerimonas nitrititolerans]|uniref:hypothetical protein n=1 Tax=Stutzerimonas nitrititolerans TaxID=2482751 RepID=UPI00289BC098|nr:hypothetical protein [Stutzerimonas nitrititolerans]